MKFLKIPENHIYNAYLIESQDEALLVRYAVQFAKKLLIKDDADTPIYVNRGFSSREKWEQSVLRRIENQKHPDFILVRPDKTDSATPVLSVKSIRENVTDTVSVRPYEAEYKIYAILHAEAMNQQAQNAILKTLEEPPQYVVILLLTANRNVFLPTILSRVIEIRAGERDIRETVAAFSKEPWVTETLQFLREIQFRSVAEILEFVRRLTENTVPVRIFFSFLEIIFRDVLCYKSTAFSQLLSMPEAEEVIIRLSNQMSYQKLGEITNLIEQDLFDLRFNVNTELMLEHFFLRLRDPRVTILSQED